AAAMVARTRTVPLPWNWAPLCALGVQCVLWAVPQVIGTASPTTLLEAPGIASGFGTLGFLTSTLGLGILAVVLGNRSRAGTVPICRSEPRAEERSTPPRAEHDGGEDPARRGDRGERRARDPARRTADDGGEDEPHDACKQDRHDDERHDEAHVASRHDGGLRAFAEERTVRRDGRERDHGAQRTQGDEHEIERLLLGRQVAEGGLEREREQEAGEDLRARLQHAQLLQQLDPVAISPLRRRLVAARPLPVVAHAATLLREGRVRDGVHRAGRPASSTPVTSSGPKLAAPGEVRIASTRRACACAITSRTRMLRTYASKLCPARRACSASASQTSCGTSRISMVAISALSASIGAVLYPSIALSSKLAPLILPNSAMRASTVSSRLARSSASKTMRPSCIMIRRLPSSSACCMLCVT